MIAALLTVIGAAGCSVLLARLGEWIAPGR